MPVSVGHLLHFARFSVLSVLAAIVYYPVLVFLLTPILLYHQLVKTVVWFTDPKCRMITGMSATFVGINPYDQPLILLCPYYLFSKKIERQTIISKFNEKIVKANLYPELRQRIALKYGYSFWKDIDNFNVEHHVRYLVPNDPYAPVTRNELRGVLGNLLAKQPFDKRFSPWEIIVVPNVVDPNNPDVKSGLLVRFNHCLMDGMSFFKFMERFSPAPFVRPVPKTMAGQKSKRLIANILTAINLFFTLPYYAICFGRNFHDSGDFGRMVRKQFSSDIAETNQASPRIPAKRMKQIARTHRVGTFSLVVTLIMAGMVKFMQRRQNAGGLDKMPKSFSANIVVPLPGHPDAKLTNYCSVIQVRVPVEEGAKNPAKLLQMINERIKTLSQTVAPLAHYIANSVIAGWIPARLYAHGTRGKDFITLSTVPSPKERAEAFGCPVVDNGFVGDKDVDGFLAISYYLYEKFWFEMPSIACHFEAERLMETCIKDVVKELEKIAD